MLKSIAFIFLSFFVSSAFGQDLTQLGGDLSTDADGRNALQLPAPNISSEERRLLQLSGFGDFHRIFTKEEGLGPSFVNRSCGGCHVDNGRGPIKFSSDNFTGSAMIIKVSTKGVNKDGTPKGVPGVGGQIQDHNLSDTPVIRPKITWIRRTREYPDGTKYSLRRPVVSLKIPKVDMKKVNTSMRMTPAMIGMGLIEEIPESAILEKSDPNDSDGDGISGKPNYVADAAKGGKSLGRFGFKATHPTVEQQSAAAFFGDMGVTTRLFLTKDKNQEVSDEALSRLVFYLKFGGVPKARNQSDLFIQSGFRLFKSIGCDSCHRVSFNMGSNNNPEYSDQTIHPFSDFLLHDMGRELADNVSQFSARGSEWRTTPLWGLGFSKSISDVRQAFLHDGRARNIEEAILWHGGESEKSKKKFMNLLSIERESLIAFLESL